MTDDGDPFSKSPLFYIPPSFTIEDTSKPSIANVNPVTGEGLPGVQHEGHTERIGISQSATAPQLDELSEMDFFGSSFRSRAHSAPSVLYEQVALQLRNISDKYNSEYSLVKIGQLAQQHRRSSMPALAHSSLPSHHQSEQPNSNRSSEGYRNRPYSPNMLHAAVLSLRAEHTPSATKPPDKVPSRRRNESISEESFDADTGDDTWALD